MLTQVACVGGRDFLGQHVQEGRAREEEILLRLTTITNAAGSTVDQSSGAPESEAYTSNTTALPKAWLACSNVDLPRPIDDPGYTWSHHRLEKPHGLKKEADKRTDEQGHLELPKRSVKARTGTGKSGKSQSVHLSTRPVSTRSLAQVETKPIKELSDNQHGSCEMAAGWQSKCDVVIFPRSSMQVRQPKDLLLFSAAVFCLTYYNADSSLDILIPFTTNS